MTYRAPLADFRLILDHLAGFSALSATTRFSDATPDTVEAVLQEAGRMCAEVIAPLNRAGDQTPARLENGVMRSSPGFERGYGALRDGGWIGVSSPPEYGGMGLPLSVGVCVNEMLAASCMALQLKPLLTQGQIEALEHHASDAIKDLYLPKLISGEWSGTMNLTEPSAGSDVGALRTKAEPNGDGSYAISGQKIFITWGDSDLVANVCHLVLARLPDGGTGTKGISLFMVPKFLPDDAGNPGIANSLKVVSLEHKMGIHGSPTCVMQYDGAKGWLVGAPHQGMAAMFTMMNNARLNVGVQGVGLAEAALQKALAYAIDRVQGRTAEGVPGIIGHADVRRMMGVMKAEVFAARAIGLACAVAIDMGRATEDAAWIARAALLTPIAKSYGTDVGIGVADMGVQIHGGMGFIEETGAAQYLRDARITSIYEGTNGIQAMDLVGRKMMDGGEAAYRLLDEVQSAAESARAAHPDLSRAVWNAAEAAREATEAVLALPMNDRFAGAVAYQRGFALVLGAHFHLGAVRIDPDRLALSALYIQRLLPAHAALFAESRLGASGLYALSPEALAK